MPPMVIPEYPPNAAGPDGSNGCFICHTPKRLSGTQVYHEGGELLIDLGVMTDEILTLDHEALGGKRPVICETCALEIAHLVGCNTPSQARLIQGELELARAEVANLREEVESYKDIRNALSKVKL